MTDPLVVSYGGNSADHYGAAAKYDFDNPQKWLTVPDVPLLDEHCMTDESGRPVATVDRNALEEIAANNNKRVRETGDPATLILGHTSDDPRAPEKPAKGFVVNYRVRPFKRDPETGQIRYTISGDYKVRHHNAKLLEEYPRRSVELWWSKRELDPIAMLGGSSPERDLGVVIRNGRINHVSMGGVAHQNSARVNAPDSSTDVIRFSSRGKFTIETYSIEQPTRFKMSGNGYPSRYNQNCGPKGKMKYEDDMMDTDDYDAGDEGIPDEGDGPDSAESDPVLAKVFQSKQWKDLSSKIDQIFQALTGGEGGPPDGMDGEEAPPSEMPPPGGGMGGPPMGGGGPGGPGMAPPPGAEAMGDDGMEPEEDERRMHGERPVQMGAADGVGGSTGFPGASDPYISNFNGKRKMTRTQTANRGRQQNPELATVKRQLHEMKLKYARAEAEKTVDGLVAEGILFGPTAEDHEKGVSEQKDYFTQLLMQKGGEEDVNYEVNEVIRKRYSRRRPNPASPASVGVARYARGQAGPEGGEDADENFEDNELQDFTKITEFADLTNPNGRMRLSRKDAIAAMRKKYGRGGHNGR